MREAFLSVQQADAAKNVAPMFRIPPPILAVAFLSVAAGCGEPRQPRTTVSPTAKTETMQPDHAGTKGSTEQDYRCNCWPRVVPASTCLTKKEFKAAQQTGRAQADAMWRSGDGKVPSFELNGVSFIYDGESKCGVSPYNEVRLTTLETRFRELIEKRGLPNWPVAGRHIPPKLLLKYLSKNAATSGRMFPVKVGKSLRLEISDSGLRIFTGKKRVGKYDDNPWLRPEDGEGFAAFIPTERSNCIVIRLNRLEVIAIDEPGRTVGFAIRVAGDEIADRLALVGKRATMFKMLRKAPLLYR